MAIKFEKIKPGMTLLDVHSQRMGNTTMSELGCWNVDIISVDPKTQTAVVRWNSNREQTYFKRQLERLFVTPPKKYRDQLASRAKSGWR